jgi:hypothetical protein
MLWILLELVNADKVDQLAVERKLRLFAVAQFHPAYVLCGSPRPWSANPGAPIPIVSITQQFNSGTSMGRLVLNVLLSFAQFEREIISERTRDKIPATRRKGKWSGGLPVLGYDVDPQVLRLVVNPKEANRVRVIFDLYLKHQALHGIATIR